MFKNWLFDVLDRRSRYEKRLEKVEARLRELEDFDRQVKGLKLEWEETYDKVTHLMARITKRAKTNPETPESTSQNALETTISEAGDLHPSPNSRVLGNHATLQTMRARHGLLPR